MCAVLWPSTSRFLSTPSARRATVSASTSGAAALNFYPRPLRGGRLYKDGEVSAEWEISIHALCEEGDMLFGGFDLIAPHFYPRPLRGGRPDDQKEAEYLGHISIHALCEEGDA